MQKKQVIPTAPYIMKAHKKGAGKEVQSHHLTIDLFTTFMYIPTAAQIKKKPPVCSLTVATKNGSTSLLTSRYLDLKALTGFIEKAEAQKNQ